ncbi:MAG: dihydrofolate reductase, partial [Flavobacteriaceae bacterium]|nr:dihydrofolate reductase [Eudoraea sp.]NNJ38097.1 dihydrofolate reductase [Flavobacteriaceae bacterium]
AQDLVEGYGVKVDQELHAEVLERNKAFKTPPYSGFVNPVLLPETDEAGEITDIKLLQPETFVEQMLSYSGTYSFLN